MRRPGCATSRTALSKESHRLLRINFSGKLRVIEETIQKMDGNVIAVRAIVFPIGERAEYRVANHS
jgi:hypothetical protein